MEEYSGVKFKTVLRKEAISKDANITQLIYWCKKFHSLGLTPDYDYHGKTASAGNLSCRIKDGFIVTAAGKDMEKVGEEDFVKVVATNTEKMEVEAIGLSPPSSESFLHDLIYQKRTDVNAIFHGHFDKITHNAGKLGIAETSEEKPYGTMELAKEVLKILGRNSVIVMKNHGFIALGGDMDAAGNLSIDTHRKASEL